MIPRARVIEICNTIAWNILRKKGDVYETPRLALAAMILRDFDLLSMREFQAKYLEHIHAPVSRLDALTARSVRQAEHEYFSRRDSHE